MIPMRDGIRLATDIYREASVTKAPVILTRTPYDRTRQKGAGERWAADGYIFVAQDCRGAKASEGVMAPYNNEGQDGYDTIEWITRQPWCDGRVGMTGGSYVGAVQWQAAAENPPGLAAIAPQATWSSFYRNLYLGGAVRLSLISGWIAGNTPRPEGAGAGDWNQALFRLPLSDVDEAYGWPMPWLDAYLTHPRPDGFWTRLDLTSRLPELRLPVLHVVGYFDFFSRESAGNFMIMQNQARDPETRRQQRLILGPWDHGSVGKTKVADFDFGPEAAVDIAEIQRDWFDRHLKRDPAARAKPFPPVRYFSMGDNVWREAETWPPGGFAGTSFYLSSKGEANTRKGDGKLVREAPANEEPDDSFRSDPANPVTSCPVTETRPVKAAVWGPVDQGPLEDREDVLAYTSDILAEALTFAGNAEAKLWISADTPDADFAVKVSDVHPGGVSQLLARGILRARYRESLLEEKLLEPGQFVEISIDLGPVAATIAPGHRLRVAVAGADFPLYDRNPNTAVGILGSETAIATATVRHRPGALSRLILPVKQK